MSYNSDEISKLKLIVEDYKKQGLNAIARGDSQSAMKYADLQRNVEDEIRKKS